MDRDRHTLNRLPPRRTKRELELAALRLVVLTGMLAAGAAVLWSHITWL